MSRKLDLQLYLLLNGYPLKDIPEERYDDYMREPEYSTNNDAMVRLITELMERDIIVSIITVRNLFSVMVGDGKLFSSSESISKSLPEAVALATYTYYSGKEWEENNE